jgi:hypothetical protein
MGIYGGAQAGKGTLYGVDLTVNGKTARVQPRQAVSLFKQCVPVNTRSIPSVRRKPFSIN